MPMLRSVLPYGIVVVCGLVLLTHNASRLIGAPAEARTKDLEFMPSATVYRLLSCGHTNTVAALRWIDSFSYIALQVDKRDDAVIGFKRGEAAGGFERLYKALIGLDPYCIDYYYYASLASALGSDNKTLAIWAYQTGLMYHPNDVSLWQGLLASLKTYRGYSPKAMNGVLAAWYAHAEDENTQRMVLQWKKFHEATTYTGLEKVYFWAQKINQQSKESRVGEIIEATLRTRMAEFQLEELHAIVESGESNGDGGVGGVSGVSSASGDSSDSGIEELVTAEDLYNHFKTTTTKGGRITFESDYLMWGPFVFSDNVYAQLEVSRADGKRRVQSAPAAMAVASDPYGFDYVKRQGKIISPGLEREEYAALLHRCTYYLEGRSIGKKRWPSDQNEAIEWMKDIYQTPPFGGQVIYSNHVFSVNYPEQATHPPIDLRQRARLWISSL